MEISDFVFRKLFDPRPRTEAFVGKDYGYRLSRSSKISPEKIDGRIVQRNAFARTSYYEYTLNNRPAPRRNLEFLSKNEKNAVGLSPRLCRYERR